MIRNLLFSLLSFFVCGLLCAQELPVVAYMGVPSAQTSLARYREMHECGFNTSISVFSTPQQLFEALDTAQQADVKLIPYCPSMLKGNRTDVQRMAEHSAFLYYMLGDEPTRKTLPEFRQKQQKLYTLMEGIPCYANMAPWYDAQTLKWLDYSTYGAYVKDFCNQLDLAVLSFDYYPIFDSFLGVKIRHTWYDNLRTVREQSIRSGKSFWGFVLSTPHAVYPQPTQEHLRLQVYANLLYGARGIQYFTYWTPEKEPKYDYYNGPISRDGRRTVTYNLVRDMNKELKAVSPLFMQGRVVAVDTYANCKRGEHGMPDAILRLEVSDSDALVCYLKADDKNYLIVQNTKLGRELEVTLNDDTKFVTVSKQLKTMRAKSFFRVASGDIIILCCI